MKVVSEDTGMEVWSTVIFAIFSSHIVTNFDAIEAFSESFNEELKVFVMKRLIAWEMCVVICECYETVRLMELRFMHTAHSPLT
jgi:hypothetical protein